MVLLEEETVKETQCQIVTSTIEKKTKIWFEIIRWISNKFLYHVLYDQRDLVVRDLSNKVD